MEFHGTWIAPISLARAVPLNSMEFHGTWNAPMSLIRAVPWNFVEFGVHQFRWHEHFHGIPWNLECANFDDMELGVWQFRWQKQFHRIHWNCMELRVRQFSMTLAIPWNSMELGMCHFRWHEQLLHGTWSALISMNSLPNYIDTFRFVLESSDRSWIWMASRQHCRNSCHISKQCDHLNFRLQCTRCYDKASYRKRVPDRRMSTFVTLNILQIRNIHQLNIELYKCVFRMWKRYQHPWLGT